ncbi:TIGR02206 family membrane protein [Evansella sp. AB-rgal1]|uniref:YwaF family protein n=1 Tax=Evansella sp. AB-rgal1 TaxID=3242696 RepID=UPI00359E01E6
MLEQIFHPSELRVDALFLSYAHIFILLLFGVCVIWMYLHRQKSYMIKVRWVLLAILLLSEILLLIWTISNNMWTVRSNLPLNLCTISIYLSAFMLITRSYRVFEIIYFFGIGGALQALLTPDLFYTFPHFRFVHFFIAHIAIILAILYMIWVYKMTPTWKSIVKSFITLNIIAFFVFLVNIQTGANYMFLARKPKGPSILDWLGPYPWYILSLEVLTLTMFILLYLPFYIKKKRL